MRDENTPTNRVKGTGKSGGDERNRANGARKKGMKLIEKETVRQTQIKTKRDKKEGETHTGEGKGRI